MLRVARHQSPRRGSIFPWSRKPRAGPAREFQEFREFVLNVFENHSLKPVFLKRLKPTHETQLTHQAAVEGSRPPLSRQIA